MAVSSRQKSVALFCDHLAFYLLTAVVALLPLITWPAAGFSLEFVKIGWWRAGLFLISFLWLVGIWFRQKITWPKSWLWWSIIALVLVSLLAALLADPVLPSLVGYPLDLNTTFNWFWLLLTMAVVIALVNSPQRAVIFLASLLAGWLILFAVELVHWFQPVSTRWLGLDDGGASNLLGRWNELAFWAGGVAVLALAALEFFDFRRARRWKIFAWLVLLTALFQLIVVNLGIVWWLVGGLAILIRLRQFFWGGEELPAAAGTLPPSPPRRWRRLIQRPAALPLALAVIFIVFNAAVPRSQSPLVRLEDRLRINSLEVRPSMPTTLRMAQAAWRENLWLGAGPNRFSTEWSKRKPAEVNLTDFWNTEFAAGFGWWPTWLVTTGLLGFLVWLATSACLLVCGWRARREPLAALIFVGTLYYLWLMPTVYTPGATLLVLAMTMVGLLVAVSAQAKLIKIWVWPRPFRAVASTPPRLFRAGLLFLLAVVVVLAATGFRQWWSWRLYNRALLAVNQDNQIDQGERDFAAAVKWYSADRYLRAAGELGVLKLSQLAQVTPPPSDLAARFQAVAAPTLAAARQATDLNAADYNNWLILARVYALLARAGVSGAYDAAKQAYQRAQSLNPQHPGLWLDLSQLAFDQKDGETARAAAESAVAKKVNWPPALFTLGHLRYQEKDFAAAVESLQAAVSLEPSYSNARYFLGLSYNELGRRSEAIAQFEVLTQLNPDNTAIADTLARWKK